MKRNKTVFYSAAAALALVSAMCILTVVGFFQGVLSENSRSNFVFGRAFNHSEKVEEELIFDAGSFQTVSIITKMGFVKVSEASGDQIVVKLVKTGWGEDEESAREMAESLFLDVSELGDTLSLEFISGIQNEIFIFSSGGTNRIDIIVSIPAGLNLIVISNLGETTVEGVTGDVSLTSSFGDIKVEGTNGSLSVDSTNGEIKLEDIIAADQVISIHSRFGKITLENFRSGELMVDSQNGDITLENGEVDGDLDVESRFGKINLESVIASSYTVNSRNGNINIEGVSGQLNIESEFGRVDISRAENVILDLFVRNGDVIFKGSLDTQNSHKLESNFGSIELSLPSDSAFDLDLTTSFGKITTDFDVFVSGEIGKEQLNGKINDGGSVLTIDTKNGDIRLLKLDNNN